MPFVPKVNRGNMEAGLPPETVGDMCYLEYKKLMEAWVKEPRWTTAHNLFKETFGVDDAQAAKTLSYLVFFDKVVMPYEHEKISDHGDIL